MRTKAFHTSLLIFSRMKRSDHVKVRVARDSTMVVYIGNTDQSARRRRLGGWGGIPPMDPPKREWGRDGGSI